MNPALRLFRNYGIALVVVAALTWFPITGFWLTILTLGLFPSLVCNLILIHLANVAWARKVSRAWLGVPIACYGVWLGWAVWKNIVVALEKSELESENHMTGPIPQNVTLCFPKVIHLPSEQRDTSLPRCECSSDRSSFQPEKRVNHSADS
jgi:hypothetical protein